MPDEYENLRSALYRKLLAANQDVREYRRRPLRERNDEDYRRLKDVAKILDTALSAMINQVKLPADKRDSRVYAICMGHYRSL